VRDLGLAHQLALEKPAAGGERFIISQGTFKYQDFGASTFSRYHSVHSIAHLNAVDAANDVTSPWPDYTLPKGVYGAGQRPDVVHMVAYDASKAASVLGLGGAQPYKTVKECTKACLDEFKKRGWKP
jgi:nucleoside-diphosphate-sugar epimerase